MYKKSYASKLCTKNIEDNHKLTVKLMSLPPHTKSPGHHHHHHHHRCCELITTFLIDRKCLQVSRNLFRFLVDFSSAIVWMISILPLVSCSRNPFSELLETIYRAISISLSLYLNVTHCFQVYGKVQIFFQFFNFLQSHTMFFWHINIQ